MITSDTWRSSLLSFLDTLKNGTYFEMDTTFGACLQYECKSYASIHFFWGLQKDHSSLWYESQDQSI